MTALCVCVSPPQAQRVAALRVSPQGDQLVCIAGNTVSAFAIVEYANAESRL